jgi:ABC-type dipeptide/oligopeptide/nickel transport system ATPase subunit
VTSLVSNSRPAAVESADLDLRDITISYRDHTTGKLQQVVRDASLHVDRSETVGLVGPSGCGKSSLARVALGVQHITAGEVLVRGQHARSRRAPEDAGDIQGVFQDAVGSLDPRQRVSAGLNELRRRYPKRTAWIGNEELLERVELPTSLLRRHPGQLSGGQAQRIAIARAVLVAPRVIVADEPTSALDLSAQAQVVRLLQTVRSDLGVGVLFISHDLAVVRQLCDRIYVMDAGQVVEEGRTEQVLSAPQSTATRRLVAFAEQSHHSYLPRETP